MLNEVKGKLIISCQALPDEPLHSPFIMGRMALAATMAGASGIRAQGMADILEIKQNTKLPIIGIVKRNYDDSEIYITPTKKEVDELLAVGVEMIALDATYFEGDFPARSAFAVKALPKGALVEIESIAVR